MNKETFGAFVAQMRREKGLTQQALADGLHVTDKAVSKWERGLSYPDLTLMEALADALGVSVTELMACQRQRQEPEKDEAVRSLLHIAKTKLRVQRKAIWIKAALALVLTLLIAAGALYSATQVSESRVGTFLVKQTEGSGCYVYLEDGEHLLRLRCPDKEIYEAIRPGAMHEYTMECSWNRLTRRGTLRSCRANEDQAAIGGMMDQIGSSMDFGSLFGVECVWQEYKSIYPDPDRKGDWIYSYRLWYSGDGSDYFAPGGETTLLLAENVRSICANDYDNDGAAELFVRTRYREEPYMLYDCENGEIAPRFVDTVPEPVGEFFQREP